jgi:hypothetical protein
MKILKAIMMNKHSGSSPQEVAGIHLHLKDGFPMKIVGNDRKEKSNLHANYRRAFHFQNASIKN